MTPAVEALPGIVAAVAGRVEVLLDGGVRRGTDVVKARALGAAACLLGRTQAFALAAAGEAGLAALLQHMQAEIDAAVALMGETKPGALGPEHLAPAGTEAG